MTMNRYPASRTRWTTATLALVASSALATTAQSAERDFQVSVGPGVVIVPEYPGSEDLDTLPIPALDLSYRDVLFANTRHGIGAWLVNREGSQVGGAISFRRGRDEDDSDRLRGLGDIDDSAVAQIFAVRDLGPLRLTAQLAQSIGESSGLTLDTSAAWRFRLAPATQVALGVRSTFGNSEYMRTWFGIDAEQAQRSGLPEYDMDAGIQSAGTFVGVNHQLSRAWAIAAVAGYDYLVGDAADSPIVEDDAKPTLMIHAAYRFGNGN